MTINWDYARYGRGESIIAGYPQTGWCFDSDAVSKKIAPHLAASGMASSARLIDVYARPGKAIDVCHAFSAPDGDVAAVTLRCSTAERVGHEFRKARKRLTDVTLITQLDELTFAWIFPEDSELAAVRAVQQRFGNTLPGQGVRLLSYRRGERCTVLDQATATVSKIQPAAASSHNRLRALYHHPLRRFAMPEPLNSKDNGQIRTERFMPGTAFDKHVAADGLQGSTKALMEALQGLHSLDDLALLELEHVNSAQILQRFESMFLRRLELTGLPIMPLCMKLRDELTGNVPENSTVNKLLHGDMHTGNVLYSGNAATLIDLDELARGDPVYDLAIYASELILMAVLQPANAKMYMDAVSITPEIYEATAKHEISRASFAWHVAALLASRQIKSCINHAAPDLLAVTTRLARIAICIARKSDIIDAFFDMEDKTVSP